VTIGPRRRPNTILSIDSDLLERARKAGTFQSDEEAVRVALEELVQRRRQYRLLELIGTVEFRHDWDPRKERQNRTSRE